MHRIDVHAGKRAVARVRQDDADGRELVLDHESVHDDASIGRTKGAERNPRNAAKGGREVGKACERGAEDE